MTITGFTGKLAQVFFQTDFLVVNHQKIVTERMELGEFQF
jgi:hypothetical protein